MTIAILGGTGRIGRHAVAALEAAGADLRLLVRAGGAAPSRLPSVVVDLDAPSGLDAALADCARLLLLTPHGPQQERREHAAVTAAARAGVAGIVKVSGCPASLSPNGPTSTAVGHWRTERLVERLGLAFAHVRPTFLFQNLLETVAPVVARTGTLVGPFADEPIAMVDARDVADCAAALLLAPELGDRAHAVTGPAAVTHRQIARALDARLVRLPLPLVERALRRRGGSAWEREHQLRMARHFATGAEGSPSDAVARLTGRAPRAVEAFLAEHARAFARSPRRRRPAPAAQEPTP